MDIRQTAWHYTPQALDRWHAQLAAYQIMLEEDLFIVRPVILGFSLQELMGEPGQRARCSLCGEEILNGREVIRDAEILCRACAGERYYQDCADAEQFPATGIASVQDIVLATRKME